MMVDPRKGSKLSISVTENAITRLSRIRFESRLGQIYNNAQSVMSRCDLLFFPCEGEGLKLFGSE